MTNKILNDLGNAILEEMKTQFWGMAFTAEPATNYTVSQVTIENAALLHPDFSVSPIARKVVNDLVQEILKAGASIFREEDKYKFKMQSRPEDFKTTFNIFLAVRK